jgi:hypothetical protein
MRAISQLTKRGCGPGLESGREDPLARVLDGFVLRRGLEKEAGEAPQARMVAVNLRLLDHLGLFAGQHIAAFSHPDGAVAPAILQFTHRQAVDALEFVDLVLQQFLGLGDVGELALYLSVAVAPVVDFEVFGRHRGFQTPYFADESGAILEG